MIPSTSLRPQRCHGLWVASWLPANAVHKSPDFPGHDDREMGNPKEKHKGQEHGERNVSFAVPAQ